MNEPVAVRGGILPVSNATIARAQEEVYATSDATTTQGTQRPGGKKKVTFDGVLMPSKETDIEKNEGKSVRHPERRRGRKPSGNPPAGDNQPTEDEIFDRNIGVTEPTNRFPKPTTRPFDNVQPIAFRPQTRDLPKLDERVE